MDSSSIISNKIITADDLREIFAKIEECCAKAQNKFDIEADQNRNLPHQHQSWSMDYFRNRFDCTVTFSDRTTRHYNDYRDFIDAFNNRTGSIKSIFLYRTIDYMDTRKIDAHNHTNYDHYRSDINVSIYEDSMSIRYEDNSTDKFLDDAYALIQSKVSLAPEKYDRIIKSRNYINTKIGFAMIAIPVAILTFLLGLVPTMRTVYADSYVIYPLITIFIAIILGTVIGTSKTERLYRSLLPRQQYAGLDKNSHQAVYNDDVVDYMEKGEVLIGKNVNNLRNRQTIQSVEKKANQLLPICCIVIGILSVIVIIVGKLWR